MPKPFLVSNESLKASDALSGAASKAERVEIAVAFLSRSEPLRAWLTRGLPVKLVVALQPPTDPDVVRGLVNAFPVHLETKFYSAGFHSKLLIFYRDGKPFCAHVGSSNLTNGGLTSNLETNVILGEPKQLQELAEHFKRIWTHSADLEPTDLDRYEEHCKGIAKEVARLSQKQRHFEGRFVRPRISQVRKSRVVKEARDYLQFWKTVDEVVKAVAPVSKREFPHVPLYLAVDHFWHWVVKVWDQKEVRQLRRDPKLRAERLPQLFKQYAAWYKGTPGYSRPLLTRDSDYLKKVLAKNRLSALTKTLARSIYRRLHSGHMRAKRFDADETFTAANSLSNIKRAFNHLLWSDGDIQERISSLLPGGRFHLTEFGASCVQELIGWVHPDEMPIRNDKADNALEMLGYKFR